MEGVKMKTYVLMISSKFPKTHKRSGDPTFFKDQILTALMGYAYSHGLKEKIHTIRGNYELWKKRFNEIDKGNACLSLRQWEGMPYRSKQIEFAKLTKDDGIGIQKLKSIDPEKGYVFYVATNNVLPVELSEIANRDGLSKSDFIEWFKGVAIYDDKPMAIIHFSKFRY